ncbi:hypothetical protein [Bacteroides salyersiae]|uniref:hypothetical protein n=1 Tax=Bacteroides salyersiae TaxID=291644 RepID=UPI00129C20B3|nr:hypothetical protein [Bacteroides salyersiae]
MPMCQLAALWQTCRMVIGTLAYWHIGILAHYSLAHYSLAHYSLAHYSLAHYY